MRISEPNREDKRRRLTEEIARFKDIDSQLNGAWVGIPEYHTLKLKRADCVAEVNHLHRDIYPHFPRVGTCGYCGGDMLPMPGNAHLMGACICCDRADSHA